MDTGHPPHGKARQKLQNSGAVAVTIRVSALSARLVRNISSLATLRPSESSFKTEGSTMSDNQMERGICELIKARHISGLRWFHVEAWQGIATIRAQVASAFDRRVCYECVRRVPGVRYVVDQIEVA